MTFIYYDTEFLERGPEHPIHFISIGMVAEDGRELYAVNADMDQHQVREHPWLSKHVWPQLPLVRPEPGMRGGSHLRLDKDHPDVRPRAQIARLVGAFIRQAADPRLMAYYSAYDHVVLAQLFGRMVDLPPYIPQNTHCLKQEAERLGDPQLPVQTHSEHHALFDARHDQVIHQFLRLMEAVQSTPQAQRS